MSARPSPESPHAWIERARSDLALAHAGFGAPSVLLEDVCFHAQQCAEKAIKALLVARAIDFPRTHSLGVLLDLLNAADINIPGNIDESFTLTQYAVATRILGPGIL